MLILRHLENALYNDVPFRDKPSPESDTYFRSVLNARLVCPAWDKAVLHLTKNDDRFLDMKFENGVPKTEYLSLTPAAHAETFATYDVMSDEAKYLRLKRFGAHAFFGQGPGIAPDAYEGMGMVDQWEVYQFLKKNIKYGRSVSFGGGVPFTRSSFRSVLLEADKDYLRSLRLSVIRIEEDPLPDDDIAIVPAEDRILELPGLECLNFGMYGLETQDGPEPTPLESSFTEVVRAAPNLRVLYVTHFPRTLDTVTLPSLKELSVQICSPACVSDLLKWECPLLEKLKMDVRLHETDFDLEPEHISQVGRHFGPSLKHLDFGYKLQNTDDLDFHRLTATFPAGAQAQNLEFLKLTDYTGRLDFLNEFQHLKELHLEQNPHASRGNVGALINGLVSLRLQPIKSLPLLQNLEIMTIKRYSGRLFLAGFPNLKKLAVNLEEVILVPPSGDTIVAMHKIQDLELHIGAPGQLDEFRSNWSLPALRSLHVKLREQRIGGHFPVPQDQMTREEFYGFISSLGGTLQKLSIDFYKVGGFSRSAATPNVHFLFPESLVQLQSLYLEDYHGDLGFLERLPALQKLELFECNPNEDQFQMTNAARLEAQLKRRLPRLKALRVTYIEVDEDFLNGQGQEDPVNDQDGPIGDADEPNDNADDNINVQDNPME